MNLAVTIAPLSFLWWMGIILSLLIGILIIQLAIRIPPDKRTILRISIGILMFFEELFNQFYMVKLGVWHSSSSLPLHLCGITGLLSAMMMIKNKQMGFEFILMPGFAGALHALLTPQLNHGGDAIQVINYYIGHSGILIVAFYLAIVEGYRLRKSSWIKSFLLIQVLLIFLGFMNWVLDANYMYLCSPPIVNNPLIIGSWPYYLAFFEVIGLLHIIVLYFIFRKMRPLPY